MGPSDFLNYLSGAGCSPYFLSSAFSSIVFGESGRKHQTEMMEENLSLRQELQAIREEFSQERTDKQIATMRELYELGRKYQQRQNILYNDSRKTEIEFLYFCNNNWPLTIDIQSALSAVKDCYIRSDAVVLDVLIAKTSVNTFTKDRLRCYDAFCNRLRDKAMNAGISNIRVLPRPWKSMAQSTSGIADAMNINYILRGKPTLILFPYVVGDKFCLDFAYWAFNTSTNHILYQKTIEFPYSLQWHDTRIIEDSMIGLIGFVRDAYMACEYHRPALFPQKAKAVLSDCPEMRLYLENQYKVLGASIQNSQEYKQICYKEEYENVLQSLNIE